MTKTMNDFLVWSMDMDGNCGLAATMVLIFCRMILLATRRDFVAMQVLFSRHLLPPVLLSISLVSTPRHVATSRAFNHRH